ncbi:PREDICTED: nuclear factor erythroid 2-related factor 1-like isoform X3 [Papilio polytes]|uniref:nuclear factor erythroid 2-related factor 1-like isoform X3 n=1 Tax=Papilio polytes TaxID=76194 RepID=UPI0006762A71|nr:PREDICTED: nuclear factor erythroid 2-related factor 1-like isoform X3 [Papilio polytes]
MIALKKLYGDELLRLALVLSLLRSNPEEYLLDESQQILAGLNISNGTDWSLEQEARTLIRPRFIHPKSLDNVLMNYERRLFEELNSLGRYTGSNARVLHAYLLNNVSTNTVQPVLSTGTDHTEEDVSADDNVAHEIKVENEDSNESELNEAEPNEPNQIQPDVVVTLSADFSNRSDFGEIASRSFDVNEFLIQPEMIKKEPDLEPLLDVNVKRENDSDLYSDNAIDFVPYFTHRSEKFEIDDPNSVYYQNLADLQDYNDIFDDVTERNELDLDIKQQENLEQYLLENTPLDAEVYELAPMFEEELVLDVKRERASTSFTSASSSGVSEMDVIDVKLEPDEGHHSGDELTQEEGPQATKVELQDEIAKELKLAEEKIQKKIEETEKIEKVKASLLDPDSKEDDPWAGLSYTVDTETGEYVIQGDLPRELVNSEESRFDLLEEALQLVELGDEAEPKDEQPEAVESVSGSSGDEMLHPAMRHVPHHPLAHYHNQTRPQRWQDLASLLTIPPPPEQYQHYQHPHNISAHGTPAGYGPNYHTPIGPVPDKHPEAYGGAAPLDGAYKVESTHHPQQHDALYYQNTGAEMAPPNQDGFLQAILNDEDLQLMDMAMNEGMYTMRMLDGAPHIPPHNHSHMTVATERDSASDSAVSSMGSERVPSLSDGEWCDGNDSAQEFHSSKFRPYDAAYSRERSHPPQKKHHMFGKRCFQEQPQTNLEPLTRTPSVVKYECPEQTYHHDLQMHNVDYSRQVVPHAPALQPALDLNAAHSSHALLQPNVSPGRYGVSGERVRHNHTYSALEPPADRHLVRDKRVRRLTDGSTSDGGSASSQHLSRDEKRAKALGIPLEVHDIINLPMDEFNERLSKHDLSEAQLSLIRDIRRRGKNKVAAQNCRKRKLDQITSLADEVRTVRDRKVRTQRDHSALQAERQRVKERFAALYRHVFQNLRDPDGRPLSSNQYSLQQAADGNVVLVPKMHHEPMNRTDDDIDRKTKHYE